MKKQISLFFTLAFIVFTLPKTNAQIDNWSLQPSISAYYTSLKINRYGFSSGNNSDEKYFENNTNLSLSLPLNNKLRLGAGFNFLATKVIREPVDRSFVSEVFFQYNFRARRKLGVYLQGGYAIGNICTCGDAEIFTSETLNHFLPFGFGLNYPLFNKIHIKAGFINYKPLKGYPDLYNWTQPFIGVNVHFFEKYNPPFKSRFRKKDKIIAKEERNTFWEDSQTRKWNVGISSNGRATSYANEVLGPNIPAGKYLEFTVVPRVNYWINQAILVGVQGTFYHFEDDTNFNALKTNGLGLGAQFKLFPLSLKNPKEYRAIRIGKRANWNIAPTVGVELHTTNFSWLEPELAGQNWEYFDFQPNVGFVLSYKKIINLFWSAGPNLGFEDIKKTSYTNGVRVIGLEYNFYKKK